ncbi:MAG: ABC transporter ATP-binding protein [Bacteroidales bacterium]
MLQATGVSKDFPGPAGPVRVLSDVNLVVRPGESLAIVGPSGSGKSTLLYILGALEPPSSGSVRLGGQDPFALDERRLAAFRNTQIGFVFQDHHLLPQCSVLENVLVPTLVARRDRRDVETRARELVERVGLAPRIDHRPHQLSGGEKQRVAIARALVHHPPLVLCDEPTGNLDGESAGAVFDLLLDLHRAGKSVLIIVTHNPDLAARLDRTARLAGGRLE